MSAPAVGTLRSSQCPQVQGRGREEELQKGKRGTGGTGEAEQRHMRGQLGKIRCTSEVHKMNNRCIVEVQQRHYTELRIHNTAISTQFNIKFTSPLTEQVLALDKDKIQIRWKPAAKKNHSAGIQISTAKCLENKTLHKARCSARLNQILALNKD